MKRMLRVFLAVLIVASCMMAGCSKAEVKEEVRKEEKEIAYLYMPPLVGLMEEEAVGKLDNLGFYNFVVEYEASDSVEPGRVTRQSIPEHTTVGTDYEIKIWISDKK
ncbi:MAG: PASTA domain-containing protein [Eubacterium sp.]|nr:PASTA domain-containing protein [Eubacterium sp.]